jgi:hypothetical protein
VNYATITKGFMHLLKKDTPFIWDERAQESFDALKKVLVSTPLLKPPDYSRDYLLYIFASEDTIGMVLVQEDDKSTSTLFIILVKLYSVLNSTTLTLKS